MKRYCCHCGKELVTKSWESGTRLGKNLRAYCSQQCNGAAKMATGKERFWARVKKASSRIACWEWADQWCGRGYPTVTCRLVKYTPVPVHQAAFFFHYGYLPDHGMICHTCDNRRCCNPHHLYHGDAKTNHEDAVKNGHWKPIPGKKGEENHQCKLTNKQVLFARKYYNTLGPGQKMALCHEYGISDTHMRRVVRSQVWQHI